MMLKLLRLILAGCCLTVVGCGTNTPVNPSTADISIVTLFDDDVNAGITTIDWDQRDDEGNRVEPGLYFAKMSADGYENTIGFRIVPVAAGSDNHNPPYPSNPPIPSEFAFGLSSTFYGVGEIVEMQFAVPLAAHVTLSVWRLDPNKY